MKKYLLILTLPLSMWGCHICHNQSLILQRELYDLRNEVHYVAYLIEQRAPLEIIDQEFYIMNQMWSEVYDHLQQERVCEYAQ